MSFVILLFFFIEHSPTLAIWIITLTLLSDKLDGSLARFWNVESTFGKQIESIADPLFVSISLLYTTVYFNIPPILIICGGSATLIISIARIILHLRTKRLFYEKSPITRFVTLLASIIIIAYLFAIPYRELLIWPALIYGSIGTLNYIRLMWQFYLQQDSEMVVE